MRIMTVMLHIQLGLIYILASHLKSIPWMSLNFTMMLHNEDILTRKITQRVKVFQNVRIFMHFLKNAPILTEMCTFSQEN